MHRRGHHQAAGQLTARATPLPGLRGPASAAGSHGIIHVSLAWSANLSGDGAKRSAGRVGELIGYARCSTIQQDLAAQREILTGLGMPADRIYLDKGLTGTTRARPGLVQALAALRCGDTLVVPKLDRLARSVPDARQIGDSWSPAVSGSPSRSCRAVPPTLPGRAPDQDPGTPGPAGRAPLVPFPGRLVRVFCQEQLDEHGVHGVLRRYHRPRRGRRPRRTCLASCRRSGTESTGAHGNAEVAIPVVARRPRTAAISWNTTVSFPWRADSFPWRADPFSPPPSSKPVRPAGLRRAISSNPAASGSLAAHRRY